MRVRLLGLLILAFPAPAAAGDVPASVRVLSCSSWQEGIGGTVSYESRMEALPGTHRMAVRFVLLEKVPGAKYRRVSAGTLHRSRSGAETFKWVHKVEGLRLGATYRSRVRYRWLAADGTEIRRARRVSKPCKQPGGPPNLRVAQVAVRDGDAQGTALYDITLVNRGDAEAQGVNVLLRVDGEVVDQSQAVDVLAPGEAFTISVSGPVCRSNLRAVVDPDDSIAESDERDNVRTARCV